MKAKLHEPTIYYTGRGMVVDYCDAIHFHEVLKIVSFATPPPPSLSHLPHKKGPERGVLRSQEDEIPISNIPISNGLRSQYPNFSLGIPRSQIDLPRPYKMYPKNFVIPLELFSPPPPYLMSLLGNIDPSERRKVKDQPFIILRVLRIFKYMTLYHQ